LFFGSEIKQLLPFIKDRLVNREVMHKFLAQTVADHTNQTFFEHILCVQPKHTLVLNLATGRVHENQYWEYHFRDDIRPDDAVEQFRELFVDSVKLRLRSDVPIGALVSGGLDSSSIAVVTNKILGIPLQTYSVISRNPEFSEEPFVDAIAREGIASHRFVVDVNKSLTALDRVIYHNDEPLLGFQVIAQFQILEAIRKQTPITVVLSGQGGDECLLGYSKFFFFYLQELLQQGHFVHAAHLFWSSLLLGTTVRQFKLTEARRYLPWRPFRKHPPFLRTYGEPEPIGRADSMRMRQMLDLDRYSVPIQTHYEDRNSMAHSLEMRTPFLDHRLVELALSLPVSLKLRSGWTKYVLRTAFPELPDAVRWRRDKKGFITPEELWLRSSLQPALQQMFSGSALQELGIVDDRCFLKYYAKFLSSPRTVSYSDISRAMIAERWARIFLMGEVPDLESVHIPEPANQLQSWTPAQA
jgi:asparagine synthase (glutamine-hydrolysing)